MPLEEASNIILQLSIQRRKASKTLILKIKLSENPKYLDNSSLVLPT